MTSTNDEQDSLREQYRDAGNLNARIRLHQRFSTNPYGWYRWLMDHFVDLPHNARILELGCGPASTWASQTNRIPGGWQVILSDFSAGMVGKARNAVGGQEAFRFAIDDAQAIPFPTGYFDGVIANHMLYHVPDLEKAMAEIRRVLKPGGVLFAATNGLRHMRELDEILWKALPDMDTSTAQNSMQNLISAFSLENGKDLIATRFETVQLALYEDGLEVNEAKPVVDYILSMLFVFDPAQRARLEEMTAKIQRTVEEDLQAHGSIHITKNAGVFIAR
jgi:ubiquinone/menaquinone biosynthesis C-methylase UbiE